MDYIKKLANDLDIFAQDVDPYEYADYIDDSESHITFLELLIRDGETDGIKRCLSSIYEELEDKQIRNRAFDLMHRLKNV